MLCPHCGAEIAPDIKFCRQCDTRLGGPEHAAAPSETVAERFQRLVPREFAERLLATRGQVSKERRVVTILFSDVKGSTAMGEDLDPEDVTEIMEGAFDVLIEPITRYEGALARLMGDGILAFFGAPIAHEDDAERACRAALEILEGARGYAARLEEQRGISGFNVRVGIHTGLVVVGEVGSDLRVEYTAMGDAVNLASRMEEAAEPGTVLITEDTHRLIAPLFETESLGPMEVRGKTQPVPVFRVVAPKADVGKPRGIAGLESPLVGRDGSSRRCAGCWSGFRRVWVVSSLWWVRRASVSPVCWRSCGRRRLLWACDGWRGGVCPTGNRWRIFPGWTCSTGFWGCRRRIPLQRFVAHYGGS